MLRDIRDIKDKKDKRDKMDKMDKMDNGQNGKKDKRDKPTNKPLITENMFRDIVKNIYFNNYGTQNPYRNRKYIYI